MAISRRTFLGSLAAGALLYPRHSGAVEFAWKYRERNYIDRTTRAYIHVLSDGASTDELTFHTDRIWTRDMRYVLYESERSGVRVPHVHFLVTGASWPLAAQPVAAWTLSRDLRFVYMQQGRQIVSQAVVSLTTSPRLPKRVTNLPIAVAEALGGLSMDADGRTLYTGVRFEEDGQWGIMAFDTKTAAWRTVALADFEIGRVQAHPTISTLVMFCHQTEGDAPQRTWVTRENNGVIAPLYKEWYNEWVANEVWWGSRVLFTIWPYNEERLKATHGIVSANLLGQDFRLHCRYPAWHTNGSLDGQWIVGDDHDGNIWLINPFDGERRLLTQGHNATGFDTPPRPSFTPDGRGVIFQSSRFGDESIMVAEIPGWDNLPRDE